jgi:hypothetical protein
MFTGMAALFTFVLGTGPIQSPVRIAIYLGMIALFLLKRKQLSREVWAGSILLWVLLTLFQIYMLVKA